jgi:hypothetical protein
MPLDPSIKWLCVAKLIQLLKSIIHRDDLFSQSKIPFLPLVKIEDSQSSYDKLKTWSIGAFVYQIMTILCNATGRQFVLSLDELKYVLWNWISFLQGVIHAVYRCIPYMLPGHSTFQQVFSPDDVTNELVLEICRYLGIDSILIQDPSSSSIFEYLLNKIENLINASITDIIPSEELSALAWKHRDSLCEVGLNIRNLERYPLVKKPDTIKLSNVYTEFHSTLTAMCSYEFPAVCLSCGAICDAGGKSKCTSHTKKCGPDGSIFFLLQDCHILLAHRKHCSYFPAPYVDYHGESHRQVRGKPLHLDTNRFESLYQLWLSHSIPQEVALSRQRSNRIIIQGYY